MKQESTSTRDIPFHMRVSFILKLKHAGDGLILICPGEGTFPKRVNVPGAHCGEEHGLNHPSPPCAAIGRWSEGFAHTAMLLREVDYMDQRGGCMPPPPDM